MKKLAATCLLIIYFTFSAGATIHLHFCMGHIVNISLSDTSKGACSNCGMSQHGGKSDCCRDVSITAKISDTHNVSYANTYFEILSPTLKPVLPVIKITPIAAEIPSSEVDYPPGSISCPLFIENRSIRI